MRAVVGAANNQLASREVADMLKGRGIVWAPDFVVNAGGVIYLDVASAPDADQAGLDARIAGIGDTVASVLRSAEATVRRRSKRPSSSPARGSTPRADGRARASRLVP